ncbi:MAG: MFS transporter [Clostridia bacterium]|nr:MFS transporter [Clostridia bacterium]
MKLNYKRVIFVGFAFFLISAFWQAYDTIVPKILTDKFGLAQTWSGAIMALDNIFALVLLPVFGAISDKVSSRFGRRTPFIVIGAVCAAVLLVGLSIPDRAQLKNIEAAAATEGDGYTEALGAIWDENPTVANWQSKDIISEKKPLQELISRDAFTSIPMTVTDEAGASTTNPDYSNIVVPARQAFAARATAKDPVPLIIFMVLLFFTLIAMGTFRSPAVALMPDVTVKPLRSKANAVINLMGTAGGILVLLLGTVMGTGKTVNALMSYTTFFSIVAGIMLVGLAIFLWKVREPQWAAEMQEESKRLGLDKSEEDQSDSTEMRKLSRGERISLGLILSSVVFWFMGYNAVTSKYSVYASTVLNVDYNTTLLIAQAAAIISYLPVGILSSKLGRKKMILGGVVILGASFFFASFLSAESPEVVKQILMPLLFALAGIGWATINVNSYPMVVELSRGSNVGKYTGFYYTASMAAQVVTPILSGLFLDHISWRTLFPYAAFFVALAFVTMLFVRHGDAKPEAKQVVLDAAGGGDD